MGAWRVTADLLATSRFVVSPLAETVAAMTVLDAPSGPSQAAFRGANRAAYDEMLAAHPTRALVAGRCWRPRRGSRPGWMADVLTWPPVQPGLGFDSELADLAAAWDDARVRAALLEVDPRRLPRRMPDEELASAVIGLLRWVWSATVQADWPRRERVLRADIVSRTAALATRGWTGVIPTLGARQEWLGDGRLQINGYDLPDRDLAGAESLSFVPVHSNGSWVAWDEPHRYAIVYPVTGALVEPAGKGPAGLARLVGDNRSRVLVALDEPRSTTGLVESLGLPLGSVGNHLRVLLDAGLVLRRRAGREVLYWRTALGDSLVATAGTTGRRR